MTALLSLSFANWFMLIIYATFISSQLNVRVNKIFFRSFHWKKICQNKCQNIKIYSYKLNHWNSNIRCKQNTQALPQFGSFIFLLFFLWLFLCTSGRHSQQIAIVNCQFVHNHRYAYHSTKMSKEKINKRMRKKQILISECDRSNKQIQQK